MTNLTALEISSADRAIYERDGFLIIRDALSPAFIETCKDAAKIWVDAKIGEWRNEGLITEDFSQYDFRHRFLAAWHAAGEPWYARSPRKECVSLAPELMFNILRHDVFLDIAAQILGTENVASHGVFNLRPKAPSQKFTDTPWHQDAQYFPDYVDVNMVNMWFPMHAVDAESSCLAFSPGSHKDGLFEGDDSERNNGFIGLSPEREQEMTCVPAALQAGDLVIFTNKTPHVAMPNNTDGMRWSWDLRFIDCADVDQEIAQLATIARHQDPSQISDFEEFKARWLTAEW